MREGALLYDLDSRLPRGLDFRPQQLRTLIDERAVSAQSIKFISDEYK